ncbi:trimeric intracellular cation channel family protein [beta proteobacterium MWH-UniP1]
MTASITLSTAQYLIELVAILAFALSGVIEAARRKLDAVGVSVVAGLAAFGGGTLRDVLLDRRPFFWVEHAELLWWLLALTIASMLFMRAKHFEPTERAMQWPDALGLGLFTAGGTQIALATGMPALVAVLMGMITAVFGGVLRDVVCNDIPKVFSDHRPYAVCAFLGGWALVLADQLGAPQWLALVVSAVIATGLRILAMVLNIQIPAWKID